MLRGPATRHGLVRSAPVGLIHIREVNPGPLAVRVEDEPKPSGLEVLHRRHGCHCATSEGAVRDWLQGLGARLCIAPT